VEEGVEEMTGRGARSGGDRVPKSDATADRGARGWTSQVKDGLKGLDGLSGERDRIGS
jgi:hypothetical protein